MKKAHLKIIIIMFLLSVSTINAHATDESGEQNFFTKRLNHRVHFGLYSSYFSDNIKMLQAGYDCALKLMPAIPDFNLLDLGLGLNALLAFNEVHETYKDNFGHTRPTHARLTPGFELNWNIRLYVIPISPIKGRVFLEGSGLGLVVYSRGFPEKEDAKGSRINVGSSLGIGMEYTINNYKAYTSLRLFHSSNGKDYVDNPALNAVGIVIGVQFK